MCVIQVVANLEWLTVDGGFPAGVSTRKTEFASPPSTFVSCSQSTLFPGVGEGISSVLAVSDVASFVSLLYNLKVSTASPVFSCPNS